MASSSSTSFKRSYSHSRVSLLCNDSPKVGEIALAETALQRDMESLSVSKRLVRSVSQKLKRKSSNKRRINGTSFGCLSLYVKGGSCRVGACEELEINGRRRFGVNEDCMPLCSVLGVERTGVECFLKKNSRKGKAVEQCSSSSSAQLFLPDDVLELILVRLPLTSLMAARLVCRKWRCLTISPQFMQLRSEGLYQNPWLFLFGITKRDGCHAGEVHALDVVSDRWYRISDDALKSRLFYAVASIGMDLYIVGGCSAPSDSNASADVSSFKTHKGVSVFNPVIGSWREAAPMKTGRSMPVLGVFEVGSGWSVFQSRPEKQERPRLKTRLGGVSDVYEDPHRFSLRRQLKDPFNEGSSLAAPERRQPKSVGYARNDRPKFGLIAVGGHGCWDEPLDSGEVYDPITNTWIEIARLPGDFGVVCTGALCGGMFYVYSEADKLAGYDLERGFWASIQISRPPPRLREFSPKLLACGSRLFMVCVSWCERDGQLNSRREKAVRKLWEMDTVAYTWTEVSRHPDAPMDWNATFVAAGDKIYGVEMFKIFGQVLDFVTACHISGTEMEWSRISRKHAAHEADVASCRTKSMLVLQL